MYFGDLTTEVKSMFMVAAIIIFFVGIAFGTLSVKDEEEGLNIYDFIMSSVLMVREIVYTTLLIFLILLVKSLL